MIWWRARRHGRGSEVRGVDDPGDARLAQEMLHATIASADLKTSILVAAITLTVTAGAPLIPFGAALTTGRWIDLAAAGLGTVAVVLCGVAGVHLLLALRPRMTGRDFSRYSLPDLLTTSVDDLTAAGPATDRREAWIQAKNLAEISMHKHSHLRRALVYYPISVALIVTAVAAGRLAA